MAQLGFWKALATFTAALPFELLQQPLLQTILCLISFVEEKKIALWIARAAFWGTE